MICKKCKKEVSNNVSICPHCKSLVINDEKKVQSSSKGAKNKFIKEDSSNLVGGVVTKDRGSIVKIEKNNKKNFKVTKNKFIKEDNSNLVGGTVSKGNGFFLKLEKKKSTANSNVERRKFINYLDYKEAKEQQEIKQQLEQLEKSRTYTEQDVSTKIVSSKSVKRSSKIGLELLKSDSDSQINNIGTKVTRKYKNKIIEVQQRIPKNTLNNSRVISVQKNNKTKSSKKCINLSKYSFGIYALVASIWIIAIYFILTINTDNYYFSENDNTIASVDNEQFEYNGVSKSGQTGGVSGEGVTSIVYDRQYLSQFNINSESDVYNLINMDSVGQKGNCPDNIILIEDEIVEKYGITAVNLCEIEYGFALELRDVVKFIYEDFPTARNYLTNLTLANVDENDSFMAAFMPIFTFSTSKSNTGYPVAIKTQIILNAKFFLNTSKLNSSVSYGTKSGYFPSNATRSSTVAHEFGHYLSYVALLKYYNTNKLNFVKASQTTLLYDVYDDFNAGDFSKKILDEAYAKYKKLYGEISFYDFRKSISTYAVAKDNKGNYIYDETIAEAFHDYYINGNNAKVASQLIVLTLKNKL